MNRFASMQNLLTVEHNQQTYKLVYLSLHRISSICYQFIKQLFPLKANPFNIISE